MQHDKTPGWGEWLMEDWFIDRFPGKSVDKYFRESPEAEHDQKLSASLVLPSKLKCIKWVNAATAPLRSVQENLRSAEVEDYHNESRRFQKRERD